MMVRLRVVVIVVMAMALIASFALAQGAPEQGDVGQDMAQGQSPPRMQEGMKHGPMMGPGSMGGMEHMRERTAIATQDGGVVVLSGDTLTKYDAQLALVGETKLAPAHGGMGKQESGAQDVIPQQPTQ